RQGTGTARIPTPTPRPFHRNGTRARVRPLTGGRDRTRGPRGLRGAPTRGIGRSPAGGTGTRGGVRARAAVQAAGATPSTGGEQHRSRRNRRSHRPDPDPPAP